MFNKLIAALIILFSQPVLAGWQEVTSKSSPVFRYFQGEIEAVNRATVSAQTSGRVQKFYFDVDDYVKTGDTIVEFTNEIQKANYKKAKANLESVKVEFQQSEIDFKRTKEIYNKKLISKSLLDQSKSKRDGLKAKFNASLEAVKQAKEQLDYTIIKAPYNGLVTRRFVEQGETINPGTPIIEGLNLVELRVVTHIPEKIIHLIKRDPKINVSFNNILLKTKDVTIFPYADKATRTFKTRIDINSNGIELFPGMTVKVGFVTGKKSSLWIPKVAVVNRSELTLVYVQNGDDKHIRHIKLGDSNGILVEVLSGLSEGESVFIQELVKTDEVKVLETTNDLDNSEQPQ